MRELFWITLTIAMLCIAIGEFVAGWLLFSTSVVLLGIIYTYKKWREEK